MSGDNIFVVIVNEPFRFASEKAAGKILGECAKIGIKPLPYIETDCEKNVTILPQCEYVAVIMNDMPLITAAYLQSVVRELAWKAKPIIEIGRGYVAERDYFGKRDKAKYRLCGSSCISVVDSMSLARVTEQLYKRKAVELMAAGAIIPMPGEVLIEDSVEVEPGATIMPYVVIGGKTIIKKDAVVDSFSIIKDAIIEESARVTASNITDSTVGRHSTVGPFAVLRAGSKIGDKVRIGDFVEVKASLIADGVKSAHLAYIGDSEIGCNCNIGCGTVFANYDGKTKHKTVVGNDVFVGCNTNLIAPVTIGDGAYIAGGTTVTEDVPEDSLCIGRVKQRNKIDYFKDG